MPEVAAGGVVDPRRGSTAARSGRRRVALALAVATVAALLTACSSSSSSSSPTTSTAASHGTAPLGSTVGEWESAHPAVSHGGASGYGPLVDTGRRRVPQLTQVRHDAGRVVGWRMAFPDHTSPAAALAAVRGQLPSDARQTASWRAPGGTVKRFCEVLTYQSTRLAGELGQPPPSGSTANIGVEIHERVAVRRGVSTLANVQQAAVTATPPAVGQRCSPSR